MALAVRSPTTYARFVYSDPFLKDHELLNAPFNFYSAVLNMIRQAQANLWLLNVYLTLGRGNSSIGKAFREAILDAARRGVKVLFIWYDEGGSTTESTEAFLAQFRGVRNIRSTTFAKSRGFIHNKIYVSDTAAYIGGQNWSNPASLDAGFLVENSPLVEDVKMYLQHVMLGSSRPPRAPFTMAKPLVQTCICPTLTGTGLQVGAVASFLSSTPMQTPTVSLPAVGGMGFQNEWQAWQSLVASAKEYIHVVNFELSTGDVIGTSPPGTSSPKQHNTIIVETLAQRAQQGVDVNLYVSTNKGPMANPTLLAQTRALLSSANVKWHWWGPRRAGANCKNLHAKITLTDTGVCVSSANLTPVYFFANTGVTTYNTGIFMFYLPGQPRLFHGEIMDFIARIGTTPVADECWGQTYPGQ